MSSKLTIDLEDKNKIILEKLKEKNRWPFGNSINKLIEAFGDIPEETKKEVMTFFKSRMSDLLKEMDQADPFKAGSILEKAKTYDTMLSYINDGMSLSYSDIMRGSDLQKVKIKDGWLIKPEDWIIVNPNEAEKSTQAGLIQCNFWQQRHIPIFIYFCGEEPFKTFASQNEHKIYSLITDIWPDFKDILKQQVKPIYDPNDPFVILNSKEFADAPTINLWPVYIEGTDDSVAKPPYGCQIVRCRQ